jgi:hypothetical protein
MNKQSIKTGIFSSELSKLLRIAFDRRQTYDYEEFVAMDETKSQKTLNDVNTFVATIETHLLSLGYGNKRGLQVRVKLSSILIPKDILFYTHEDFSRWRNVKQSFVSTVIREGFVLF